MTATTFPWACKSDGTPVLTPRWVMIVLIKNWSERIWKGCSVGWLLIKLNYFVSSWCCFSHIAAVIFLVKHRTLFPNQPWCWEEHLQLRFALHCILLYASYRSRSLGFLDSCPLFLCGLLCAFESDNLFIVDFTGLQTALLQHLMHMHVKKWGEHQLQQLHTTAAWIPALCRLALSDHTFPALCCQINCMDLPLLFGRERKAYRQEYMSLIAAGWLTAVF